MADIKAIGERIRLSRKRALLNQDDMCEKLGMVKATYRNIERGRTAGGARIGILALISEITHADLIWLITGEK